MAKSVKFEVRDMLGLGLILVVTGIALAYGLEISGDIQDDFGTSDCNDASGFWNEATNVCQVSSTNTTQAAGFSQGFAYNGSSDAITGTANFTGKLPTISLVIVAAILIGILVNYLYRRVM